ncbi:MAG: SPFH domain-containing protein [Pseudomonadota bacterium]
MLLKKLLGEFIDVIEWTDDSRNTMVWRFERYGNEIKNGAQLTVRASQIAVFVSEGQIADVFGPGMYTLETQNLPILSTLQGWVHGFKSPFKAEVYFVNTRRFTDLKWGTRNPIMLRDPEFGPIRLRAFGSYVVRVIEGGTFIREIVGSDGHFTVEEIEQQLRNMIISRMGVVLGESGIPALDMAANYAELGRFITNAIQPRFVTYGLELTQLLVENVSLPPQVEEALDKRSQMGLIGNLKDYQQFQAAEAMAKAAAQPGGAAGDGLGMAMGLMMAGQISNAMGGGGPWGQAPAATPAPAAPPGPPPLPPSVSYHVALDGQAQGPYGLGQLQQLAARGTLTRDTLVWAQGMASWQPAGQEAALKTLFASSPPPLPPGV